MLGYVIRCPLFVGTWNIAVLTHWVLGSAIFFLLADSVLPHLLTANSVNFFLLTTWDLFPIPDVTFSNAAINVIKLLNATLWFEPANFITTYVLIWSVLKDPSYLGKCLYDESFAAATRKSSTELKHLVAQTKPSRLRTGRFRTYLSKHTSKDYPTFRTKLFKRYFLSLTCSSTSLCACAGRNVLRLPKVICFVLVFQKDFAIAFR